MTFYQFTSRQLVGLEISAKILEFFDKGLTKYLMLPEERYLQQNKKLGETIKLFSVSPYQNTNLKRMIPVEFLPEKWPRKFVEYRKKLI